MAIERTSDLEERSEQNIHTTVGKKKKKGRRHRNKCVNNK